MLMTYELLTTEHGRINAGFYGCFFQLTQFGDYCFTTKHLCSLTKNLAENQDLFKDTIIGYSQDFFEEHRTQGVQSIIQKIIRQEDIGIEGSPLEKFSDVQSQGLVLGVAVPQDNSSITIGKYTIPSQNWAHFSWYLARGGWFGWDKAAVPNFSVPTLDAITNSERKLYESIQKK